MAGKLSSQGGVNAVCPGELLFVTDNNTGVKFLVDSGATVSMLPGPSSTSSSAPPLKTASGSRIATGAERHLNLSFRTSTSSSVVFPWDFLFGHVDGPILGNDFLKANNFCVDTAAEQLLHKPTGNIIPGVISFSLGSAAAVLPDNISNLLRRFPSVVHSEGPLPPAAHGVEHHLQTSGQPVTARFRRLDSTKLAAAKSIFSDWEKAGIIRRSSSAWASPLHLVKKKDGSWRPCGDFRRLNLITSADKYPVPNMADFAGQVEGCSVFSKLDLKNGYLQVPLHPSAVPKTALITPFGLFEFLRMPFGLKNAGMSFQRLMDRIMAGIPFVFVYIDDILVASPDMATHLQHLNIVLEKLQAAGLVLNIEKCVFAKSQLDFLGHNISAQGSRPLRDKVAAIAQHPQPGTVKELQQFLGMINFYRKFMPGAAKLLCPLTDALKGGPPPTAALQWTPQMLAAFAAAKEALSSATWLAHPVAAAELSLVCDASSTHVGAVIQQRFCSAAAWQPLGFFSQKLDKAQLSYSAFDRELFAAYAAIRHFRYQLEGRTFSLWTDHKPLISSIRRSDEAWTPRQQRQSAYITEFTDDIRHIAGVENVVADALSRPPAPPSSFPAVNLVRAVVSLSGAVSRPASIQSTNVCPGPSSPSSSPPSPAHCISSAVPVARAVPDTTLDLAVLAAAQATCPETAALVESQLLTITHVLVDNLPLLCDTTTGSLRPLVPKAHRQQIFNAVHELGHPGIRATRRLISTRWVWKKMSSDIAAWCKDCQNCQRAKVTRQPKAPLERFHVPASKFSHIHVDLVGPLPPCNGFNHLLTIVDRSSRWLEAVPLSSTTATAVADALIAGWVARFGVPTDLTSDRGVQFCSEVWGVLMERLGIRHHLTTAYHPQANGMVERSHRQIKDALRARLASADWLSHLPWVLLSLRATPKDDSNISSAEMVYGSPLSLPGELRSQSPPPPSPLLQAGQQAATGNTSLPAFLPTRNQPPPSSATSLPKALQEAEYVYVRRSGMSPPLTPVYSGPSKQRM